MHYSKRCSGYQNFEQIEELRPFQGIVLFKYPVSFTINDSGRYNFPMLIEIEDDKQTCDFVDEEIQEGVCICNHRLNITPSNCRIYFFSENAYKITLINTQSNKGIKPVAILAGPAACSAPAVKNGMKDIYFPSYFKYVF